MHNARWYMHRILPRDPLICNLNSPLATRRYTKSKKCSHDPLFHYTNYRLFQQNFSVEHLKLRPLRKNHSAVMAKVWIIRINPDFSSRSTAPLLLMLQTTLLCAVEVRIKASLMGATKKPLDTYWGLKACVTCKTATFMRKVQLQWSCGVHQSVEHLYFLQWSFLWDSGRWLL